MAIAYKNTRNLTHGLLTIVDGGAGGAQKTLEIPVQEGDLQFTADPDPAVVVMNRATLSHFTAQAKVPVRGRFTIKFSEWKGKGFSGANPSPYDAMTKTGNASSWVSVTECGPYCVDLKFDISNPCSGAGTGVDQAESLLFENVKCGPFSFREGSDYDRIEVEFTALTTAPVSTRTGT